jgi:hypothetical protein
MFEERKRECEEGMSSLELAGKDKVRRKCCKSEGRGSEESTMRGQGEGE